MFFGKGSEKLIPLTKDARGLLLCNPCWDGEHDHKARGGPVSRCLRGGCQCPCYELARERHPRVLKDKSLQQSIDGGEPLNITARS